MLGGMQPEDSRAMPRHNARLVTECRDAGSRRFIHFDYVGWDEEIVANPIACSKILYPSRIAGHVAMLQALA